MSSILIAGSGAMACLFAARLSAAGIQVTLLDEWEQGLQALATNGVRLVNPDGTITSYPVHIAHQQRNVVFRQPVDFAPATEAPPPQEAPSPPEALPPQVALVLVKSWQTTHTAHQLSGCLADDGLAVTLQNGLGNREALQEVLGESRVSLGVTTLGATLVGPGIVQPGGDGKIVLAKQPSNKNVIAGEPNRDNLSNTSHKIGKAGLLRFARNDNDAAHTRIAALANILTRAGFQVEFSDQPEALLWGKLVINAAINPITALLNVPNGEILASQAARQVMAAAAKEAAEVARARGIRLPFGNPVEEAEKVARQTATNRSSMLQDILRGAPTEIEAICGAIVREGEVLGIPTPINWTLFNLIKAKVEK
jgi:2-dehydropantoate 2-reductase